MCYIFCYFHCHSLSPPLKLLSTCYYSHFLTSPSTFCRRTVHRVWALTGLCVSQSVSHQSHGSHELGAWFQFTHQPNLPSSLYVQAAFHLHQPPPLSWIRSEIFHSHAVMCAVSSVWNARGILHNLWRGPLEILPIFHFHFQPSPSWEYLESCYFLNLHGILLCHS